MVGLGFGVLFSGYVLLTYGWSQIRGSNATMVQLVWPGSFQNVAKPDSGTPDSSSNQSITGTATVPGTVPNSGGVRSPNTLLPVQPPGIRGTPPARIV